jgi:hypothetical protein
MEYVSQHAGHGSDGAVSTQANVTSFSVNLCQPGELEPWWAKLIIIGAFVAFIGVITAFIRDVWIWNHRAKL